MSADLEPLCTPAEVSLGQVLDALPDDSPWLQRLELCDEDWGRPISDGLRLQRWCLVLVDMHFPALSVAERSELWQRFSRAVWAAYAKYRWGLPWERDRWVQAWVEAHPEGATLEEVGNALGVTSARVAQIEEKARYKLRRLVCGRAAWMRGEDKYD